MASWSSALFIYRADYVKSRAGLWLSITDLVCISKLKYLRLIMEVVQYSLWLDRYLIKPWTTNPPVVSDTVEVVGEELQSHCQLIGLLKEQYLIVHPGKSHFIFTVFSKAILYIGIISDRRYFVHVPTSW